MAMLLYPFPVIKIRNIMRCYCAQLPLEAVVLLGCYGIGMLAWGLIVFPNCPEEAKLLQDVRNLHTAVQSLRPSTLQTYEGQ